MPIPPHQTQTLYLLYAQLLSNCIKHHREQNRIVRLLYEETMQPIY